MYSQIVFQTKQLLTMIDFSALTSALADMASQLSTWPVSKTLCLKNGLSIQDYICRLLAKVPALLCRLGRVPYDRAFGALMGGRSSIRLHLRALIVCSLSIKKSFTKEKT